MKIRTGKSVLAIGAGMLFLSGCSSVSFFDTSVSTTEKSGFLYYPPKPYLLIEQGEKSVTTRLITIPDLSRPHRVKHSQGLGTTEMGFDIENGMIKKFNSKSDSKTSEGLTALAALGTAKAAIVAAEATKAATTQELQAVVSKKKDGFERFNIVIVVDAIKSINDDVVSELEQASTKTIFKAEIETLKKQATDLDGLSTIKYPKGDPDKLISQLEEYRKQTVTIINELTGVESILKIYAENPKLYRDDFKFALNANVSLAMVISKLREFSSRSSSIVGLYEIQFVRGKLHLRKVSLE